MENRERFKQDILKRMLELATKLVKEEEGSSTIPQGKYSIPIHKSSKSKMKEQIKPKTKENMNRVKPPYRFKIPYWTHDPAGKQNDKYRFGLLSFGPNGGFKEISNSESNYYKACTLNLPSYMDKVLDLYREEYKKLRERILYGN